MTLDGGNFSYVAGIWESMSGEWPPSYRIATVAANPKVARYQDRHGAIIHRRQVMQWLDTSGPEIDLLATPPARTFVVEEIGPPSNGAAALSGQRAGQHETHRLPFGRETSAFARKARRFS